MYCLEAAERGGLDVERMIKFLNSSKIIKVLNVPITAPITTIQKAMTSGGSEQVKVFHDDYESPMGVAHTMPNIDELHLHTHDPAQQMW